MPAPPLIQYVETNWTTGATSKASAAFPVLDGDKLVVAALINRTSGSNVLTISGGGLAWNLDATYDAPFQTAAYIWRANVSADDPAVVVTVAGANASFNSFGFGAFTFRGSPGVGANAQATFGLVNEGATVPITTNQSNSAIVVASVERIPSDDDPRVWWGEAGPVTEMSYTDQSGYRFYVGLYPDVAQGTFFVGQRVPENQQGAIAALEILGTVEDPPPASMTGFGLT
jgi:hypothetical protein